MRYWIPVVLACLVALGWALVLRKPKPPPPPPPPLTHEIYIWQQEWTQPLREAMATAKPECAGLLPLGARITWQGVKPTVTWPTVPWLEVAGGRLPVAVAIRVEPLAGPDAAQPAARDAVAATALECVRRAESQGVTVPEVQLDFDAAESQLGVYADWLGRLRTVVAPRRITFTALPSWLHQPAFKQLAGAADGYVLQVHATDRPTPKSKRLCDEEKARQWVAEAATAAPGVPFRVALPTYTYEFAFAPDNTCLGVVAEGEQRDWPSDSRVIFLRADPVSLARLRDAWNTTRPAELTGVLWFRLPVATDERNWRWPTLRALIHGGVPRGELVTRGRLDAAGTLCDLTFENVGNADIAPPEVVTVNWEHTACETGDPLPDFSLTTGPSTAVFRARDVAPGTPIRLVRPGQSVAVGWLRFEQPMTLESLTFTVK